MIASLGWEVWSTLINFNSVFNCILVFFIDALKTKCTNNNSILHFPGSTYGLWYQSSFWCLKMVEKQPVTWTKAVAEKSCPVANIYNTLHAYNKTQSAMRYSHRKPSCQISFILYSNNKNNLHHSQHKLHCRRKVSDKQVQQTDRKANSESPVVCQVARWNGTCILVQVVKRLNTQLLLTGAKATV